MNLHSLRQPNAPLQDLVIFFGKDIIIDELFEMCFDNMADWALDLSLKLDIYPKTDAYKVARIAASIILNSGSYSSASREAAKKFLAADIK